MAFYKIAALADVYDGCRIKAQVGQVRVLLIQDEGRIVVVEDRCPHMDAPLSTGQVKAGHIICRAHGIPFDLQSGKAQGPLSDTLSCLRFFDPVYEGNCVGVEF